MKIGNWKMVKSGKREENPNAEGAEEARRRVREEAESLDGRA